MPRLSDVIGDSRPSGHQLLALRTWPEDEGGKLRVTCPKCSAELACDESLIATKGHARVASTSLRFQPTNRWRRLSPSRVGFPFAPSVSSCLLGRGKSALPGDRHCAAQPGGDTPHSPAGTLPITPPITPSTLAATAGGYLRDTLLFLHRGHTPFYSAGFLHRGHTPFSSAGFGITSNVTF